MPQAANVEYVTCPGEFVGLGFVVDDVGPFGVEGFAFGFVEGLVGVGAEEVALGLEEVGGEAGGAVAVVVADGGAEGGDGDAVGDTEGG